MTLAKQAARRLDAPTLLAKPALQHQPALILGSVLPDLPYHARFFRQLFLHLAGREYLLSEWGDLLHHRGTGRLALGILEHLERSQLPHQEQMPVLALAAGYLCHHAVDRVVHPVINLLVEREGKRSDRHPIVLHARMERYQNLFYHQDLLGHDMVCTPFPKELVYEMAGAGLVRPRLEEPLHRAIRATCLSTHGRAPTASQLADWLWGITMYGHLLSSPLARMERLSGDLHSLRSSYYEGPEVDLAAPLGQALETTVQSWHACEAVLRAERITSEVRDVFLHQVADVDLATGA
jgi:hypothetical protein